MTPHPHMSDTWPRTDTGSVNTETNQGLPHLHHQKKRRLTRTICIQHNLFSPTFIGLLPILSKVAFLRCWEAAGSIYYKPTDSHD